MTREVFTDLTYRMSAISAEIERETFHDENQKDLLRATMGSLFGYLNMAIDGAKLEGASDDE